MALKLFTLCIDLYKKYITENVLQNFNEQYCNIKPEMRSFKSSENIHKKEGGSYYVVSAYKASSVTL